ncbi:hypothetical protein PaG_06328 [Moesziomyces aphidis]|uniref:Uncharacterized protein n=1 Tax=Moesziomyces aphidis TaxID=84754 RepID=W3VGF2_MOEAP|nr:hypothetical protein PaG_06328 [Moesziomyces aphidis]
MAVIRGQGQDGRVHGRSIAPPRSAKQPHRNDDARSSALTCNEARARQHMVATRNALLGTTQLSVVYSNSCSNWSKVSGDEQQKQQQRRKSVPNRPRGETDTGEVRDRRDAWLRTLRPQSIRQRGPTDDALLLAAERARIQCCAEMHAAPLAPRLLTRADTAGMPRAARLRMRLGCADEGRPMQINADQRVFFSLPLANATMPQCQNATLEPADAKFVDHRHPFLCRTSVKQLRRAQRLPFDNVQDGQVGSPAQQHTVAALPLLSLRSAPALLSLEFERRAMLNAS